MNKDRLRANWLATRPYSFTATLVPVAIGAAASRVIFRGLHFDPWMFLLTLLGCLAIHIVSNVLNDVYDARSGLDNAENFGRYNAVVSGQMTEREMLRLVAIFSVVSLAVGIFFFAKVGVPILWLIVSGGLLAFFYTMPPVRLKHHALGDIAVLLGFGLGMAFGSYIVQAHGMKGYLGAGRLLELLAYALPTGLPIVGILHANNHRDRANDLKFGARTLANSLGVPQSKAFLLAVLVAPPLLFVATTLGGLTTAWCFLSLLAMPALRRIAKEIRHDHFEGPLVPQIAQYHGLYGLLTTIGLVIKGLQR